ncbi:MAG: DivIVA domain-containing protein [Oscillospiraceae bacterium]|jgi:cell division initiation protein|nr:DivIVA domain-containing protein [Oscillospiraceae bacterium]
MILTVEDIKNVSFRKGRGYRASDVDSFLDELQMSYKSLQKENSDLLGKIGALNKKIEEYQKEEEFVKAALINAQKVADVSVREAELKAELILKNALIEAERSVVEHKKNLENIKKETAEFRANLLDAYKKHLKLITEIPNEEENYNSDFQEKINNTGAVNVEEKENNEKLMPNEPKAVDIATSDSGNNNDKYKIKPTRRFINLQFGDEYKISSIEEQSSAGLWNRDN